MNTRNITIDARYGSWFRGTKIKLTFSYVEVVDESIDTILYFLNDDIATSDGYNYLLSPVVRPNYFTNHYDDLLIEIEDRVKSLMKHMTVSPNKLEDRIALTKQAYLKFVSHNTGTPILPTGWFRKETDVTTPLEKRIAKLGIWFTNDKQSGDLILNDLDSKMSCNVVTPFFRETNGYYDTLNLCLMSVLNSVNLTIEERGRSNEDQESAL